MTTQISTQHRRETDQDHNECRGHCLHCAAWAGEL